MLRIIAGRYRGRKLLTAPGDDVRPTSDRVREAIFNKLTHGLVVKAGAPLTGVRVADVFAGTGAMGFEALSRGAEHVALIENNPKALALIGRNARALDLEKDLSFVLRSALAPGPAAQPSTLLFLDAPYRTGLSAAALAALASEGWCAEGAVITVEVAAGEDMTPPPEFSVLEARRYGAAKIVFLRYGAPA
jgi:16S rRNA (guanine966-N2)-methyltransferase